MVQIYGKNELCQLLPHQKPMLLVDSIQVDADGTSIGEYQFTGMEWFFQGHYPEYPIVPGVILCEIMAQSSCGLFSQIDKKHPYLVGIDHMRFRHVVKPKDTIFIETKLNKNVGDFYFVGGKIYLEGHKVLCADGELILCLNK